MVLFFIICALMVLLALWLVEPPLFQSARDVKVGDARAANLLVYQDQLRERSEGTRLNSSHTLESRMPSSA